jgi:hypothetical protein
VPSFAPTLLPSAASVENLWLLNRSSGLQRMMFLPLEDRLPGNSVLVSTRMKRRVTLLTNLESGVVH